MMTDQAKPFHLADIVDGVAAGRPESVHMAVLRAFFDASGHPNEPNRRVLTVGGYLSSKLLWARFERRWNAALAKYEVPELHMNRLAQWAKPFDAWGRDEGKRVAFLHELTTAIKVGVRKAWSITLSLDDYDSVNAEYELDTLYTPYSICASQVISDIQKWTRARDPNDEVVYFFEKGDRHQGSLATALERRKLSLRADPIFLHKRWKNANGEITYVRQFEACDLWAYEDGKAFPLINMNIKARLSFKHLSEQIPCSRGGFNAAGLRDICRVLDIPKRSGVGRT
jgi:hypothetical protein